MDLIPFRHDSPSNPVIFSRCLRTSGSPSLQQEVPAHAHKFASLDALRGLAALTVVFYHLFPSNWLFRRGYLAVDFFFMLSGFVMTHAYQRQLDAGLPLQDFAKLRLLRLFPLYLPAALLGLLYALSQAHVQHTGGLGHILVVGLVGLVFLPYPSHTFPSFMFPFNDPSWSLFSELVVNVIHAVSLRRRSLRTLAIASALAAAVLCAAALHMGSYNNGSTWPRIGFGVARALFGYLAGMCLYRLWTRNSLRWRVPAILPAALLVLILTIPVLPRGDLYVDLIAVFLAFPFLLASAATAKPNPAIAAIAKNLGLPSYAIYVLHIPLSRWWHSLWHATLHHWPDTQRPRLLLIASVLIVGYCADRWYDVPLRRWLRRHTTA
jgi:peptidoglycan/LPS O-acetylase OafA/YrhL